jgi:hypothetical protein
MRLEWRERQDVISDSLLRRRVHDERMRERPKFIQVDEVARTHAFRFEASGMGKRLRNGIRASRG